ncbi:MAG: pseudaminic acid synthase [Bacteroidales bacterium]|jgi:pseudaminic acid synthase|nr:pseudaminic acid synthase [Bacteroidales bacterium]
MKNKTFIIAELSANHRHDFDLAVKTIEAIAASGADAVKIQTYKPESLTMDVYNAYFGPKKTGTWKGIRPYDLYKEGAMPYEWQPKLKSVSEDNGLVFFSTPFDIEGVDFLESMGVPMYKIASFEINDIPLIHYVASKGKPIIMSTGLGDLQDIEMAIKACYEVGNREVSLLKCTSEYPASIEQANLLTMVDMKQRFGVKVGISDHTMGELVPTVAVSLGAEIIEKHFILSREIGGPDAVFSTEPHEFKQMVDAIRKVEKAMGEVNYYVSDENKYKRRSLFVAKDIPEGEEATKDNIRSVRTAAGLPPMYFDELLGMKSKRYLKRGEPVNREDFYKK